MDFIITFYATVDGTQTVAEWLDSVRESDPLLEKLIVSGLARLRQSERHGPPLTEAIAATPGMYELRVGRANIARVFFFRPGQEIVVTNGYVKKRQRLDPAELRRAVRYKDDWARRHP